MVRMLLCVATLLLAQAPEKSPVVAMEFGGKTVVATPVRPGPIFTIEAELTVNNTDSKTVIGNVHKSGIGVGMRDGFIYASVHDGKGYVTAQSKQPIMKGKKYAIAAVFERAKVSIFVDGVLQEVTAMRGPRRKSRWPIFIGADPDVKGRAENYFEGRMYGVRLSNTARYSNDYAVVPFETDRSTVALYEFSTRTKRLTDHSGKRNEAKLVNPIWVAEDTVANQKPNSVELVPHASISELEDIENANLAQESELGKPTGFFSKLAEDAAKAYAKDRIVAADATTFQRQKVADEAKRRYLSDQAFEVEFRAEVVDVLGSGDRYRIQVRRPLVKDFSYNTSYNTQHFSSALIYVREYLSTLDLQGLRIGDRIKLRGTASLSVQSKCPWVSVYRVNYGGTRSVPFGLSLKSVLAVEKLTAQAKPLAKASRESVTKPALPVSDKFQTTALEQAAAFRSRIGKHGEAAHAKFCDEPKLLRKQNKLTYGSYKKFLKEVGVPQGGFDISFPAELRYLAEGPIRRNIAGSSKRTKFYSQRFGFQHLPTHHSIGGNKVRLPRSFLVTIYDEDVAKNLAKLDKGALVTVKARMAYRVERGGQDPSRRFARRLKSSSATSIIEIADVLLPANHTVRFELSEVTLEPSK
ncbi:LamG domain-containing protein [bacterium]|nr:LamG domain-containing protein [bacterium]